MSQYKPMKNSKIAGQPPVSPKGIDPQELCSVTMNNDPVENAKKDRLESDVDAPECTGGLMSLKVRTGK